MDLINRFKEPSSYAAVAAVLALVGINIDAELWGYIVSACAALAGVFGFFMKEKGNGA